MDRENPQSLTPCGVLMANNHNFDRRCPHLWENAPTTAHLHPLWERSSIKRCVCPCQHDVSSAIVGGQIAADVIAECEQNNDFPFNALNNTRRWPLLHWILTRNSTVYSATSCSTSFRELFPKTCPSRTRSCPARTFSF